MKDSYSCDRDEAGLDRSYWAHHAAYTGSSSGSASTPSPSPRTSGSWAGRRRTSSCSSPRRRGCPGPVRVRRLRRQPPGRRDQPADPAPEALLPVERSPPCTPRSRRWPPSWAWAPSGPPRPPSSSPATAPGHRHRPRDHEVNETKLVNAVGAKGGIRPAQVEEIRKAGMEPGYGSPVGARDTLVVVDSLAARSPNWWPAPTARASPAQRERRPRFHGRHGHRHHQRRGGRSLPGLRPAADPGSGIEVGTSSSSARVHGRPGREVPGEDGERHSIVMGSYGIGLGRSVACVVEAHHDAKGIAWPDEVAPYAAIWSPSAPDGMPP